MLIRDFFIQDDKWICGPSVMTYNCLQKESKYSKNVKYRWSNRMRTMQLKFSKWRNFLWCKKNKISILDYMRKTYLGMILRIQMLNLFYFPLWPIPPLKEKDSFTIFRNDVTKLLAFWRTSNLCFYCSVVYLV